MKENQPPSLESLQTKASRFDVAINCVKISSQNLGGEHGPKRLFYGIEDPSEKIGRIRRVSEVRRAINTKTLPTLEAHAEKIREQVKAHPELRIRQDIEVIRQLVDQGYATSEELQLAEEALQSYQRSSVKPQPAPKEQLPAIETFESTQIIPGWVKVTMPDGEKIDMTEFNFRVLQPLYGSTRETPVDDLKWIDIVWPDGGATTDNNLKKLSSAKNILQKRLRLQNWQIVNLNRRRVSHGRYYLKQITQKEQEVLPRIDFDAQKRSIRINEGPTIHLGKIQTAVVGYLYNHPGRNLKISKLLRVAAEVGSKAKSTEVIVLLLDRVEARVGQQIFKVTEGRYTADAKWSLPRFVSQSLETDKKQEAEDQKKKRYQEGLQIFERRLPDGQELTGLSRNQPRIMEGLLYSSQDKPVTNVELSRFVYGDEISEEVALNRLSVALVNLKKKLGEKNWRVMSVKIGHGVAYYLSSQPQEPSIKGGVETISTTEEDGLTGRVTEEEEITVIPYEPSEEEKRSDEETKILEFFVTAFDVQRKIRFEDLQKALYSEKRVRKVGKKERLIVYQARELKEMFRIALKKMREEAEITTLRNEWNVQEEKLWVRLQQLLQRMSGNDINDFIRKVSAQIDRAEREFYNQFPSEEGHKVFGIDL